MPDREADREAMIGLACAVGSWAATIGLVILVFVLFRLFS